MAQTIFITGASSGIGKTTAALFQRQGWNVVATMRNIDDGAELAALDNVMVARLDVLDSASIHAAIHAAIARFGQIDVLLNNAGYGAYGVLEAFDMDRVRRQFDTNVIGLIDVTKAALPHMRAAGSGTVINISSIGGQMTFPLGALYHGTKFAVEGISEAMSYELESIGLRVKIVEPGMIATDFGGRSFDFATENVPQEYGLAMAGMGNAMQHYGANLSAPEVVADVIWQAATDGTDQLRYRAGADAHALLDARKTQDDATFMGEMKRHMAGA